MTYRVCFDEAGVLRTETFPTEGEALVRARRLLDADERCAIAIEDGSGEVLSGVRLQLKLGFPVA